MKTALSSQEATISSPQAMSSDLTAASYDIHSREIVVNFRDGKIARIPTTEFDELATATTADYEFLEGTRAGVT